MKRVVFIPSKIMGNDKYILQEEYKNFGIYERMTSTGFLVNQEWLVYNGTIGFISQSYNNRCLEEILDFINTYNETGKFGLKGFMADASKNIYGEHPSNHSYSF